MLVLLLLAAWIAGVATVALLLLIRQIQAGVIRSKYGHKTYCNQEPLKFWFAILLGLAVILVLYYVALMMFLAAFNANK